MQGPLFGATLRYPQKLLVFSGQEKIVCWL